jgi:hypothetical protein
MLTAGVVSAAWSHATLAAFRAAVTDLLAAPDAGASIAPTGMQGMLES